MEENQVPVHAPVLLRETLFHLAPQGGRFIDGTCGAGGHSAAILGAHPDNRLLGLDVDPAALALARARLAEFGERAQLRHGSYTGMAAFAAELGWEQVDGVLLDFGVSSMQIDQAERGFSYRAELDGPLDMRFDRRQTLTAAWLLNHADERELTRLFREHGELPFARSLARAVTARRAEQPWERTGEFADLVRHVAGPRRAGRQSPPEGRAFQALRIAVNDELETVRQGLSEGVALLAPEGRIVAISFHSGEDRIVKQFFRFEEQECVCPPGLPVCRCGKIPRLEVLTSKPVQCDEDEARQNPRARPARLRAARRLDQKRLPARREL